MKPPLSFPTSTKQLADSPFREVHVVSPWTSRSRVVVVTKHPTDQGTHWINLAGVLEERTSYPIIPRDNLLDLDEGLDPRELLFGCWNQTAAFSAASIALHRRKNRELPHWNQSTRRTSMGRAFS